MELQITDLTEKFETIKAKRLEDRSKLKDAEKTKIMYEQVIEIIVLACDRDLCVNQRCGSSCEQAMKIVFEQVIDIIV